MSTTPTFAYLALDADNDPVFTAGTSLTGAPAVGQAVLTRLNLFYGEWWESLAEGLPVFQSILGQLGSAAGLAAMQLEVRKVIEGTPYVTAITSFSTQFQDGRLSFTASIQTAFGPVTVTSLPGQQAVID